MQRIVILILVICYLTMGIVQAETVVGDPESRIDAGKIEYQGSVYRPKRRLTTVLLIGTDIRSGEEDSGASRSGGQADFLVLIVIDDNAGTVTPIQINRDTMVDIRAFSEFGQKMGLWNAQICLAHSFGNNQEQACELTADAVSRYLKNILIDRYISMNLDGISALNDALGGITVTLEDDFSAYDASMLPGVTMTLQGKQAEYYTRMRYHVGDQTNASRLLRQQQYMALAATQFAQKAAENPSFAEELYRELEPYIVTDMTQGRMINLASQTVEYEILEMTEIEGTSRLGDSGYVEFLPDEDAVWQTVLNVFYEELVD